MTLENFRANLAQALAVFLHRQDLKVDCQVPCFRALFGDNRPRNFTFYDEFVKSGAVD